MGYTSLFFPTGWVTRIIYSCHSFLDLPWFWSIVIGTVFFRLLMFPLLLKVTKNQALLAKVTPQMQAHTKALQEAKASGDMDKLQIEVKKRQGIIEESGANVNWVFGGIPVQLITVMAPFIAVNRLCKLPELHDSGVSFLPDLYVSNPVVLPALSIAMIVTAMKVSVLAF
jgi:YidC/Oxa1 family membrane protein insertase